VVALAFVPLVLQALAMLVDEGVHHRRRGLGAWERIGHPIDTLTTATCYAWLLVARVSLTSAIVYGGLAFTSCLVVTKDESVHADECSAAEHWNHAVLFMLHPVVLGVAAWLWWASSSTSHAILVALLASTLGFAAYQFIYWNGPWQRRRSR
jgi:hypothetical protein